MRYIRKGAVMLFLLALTGCSKDEAGNDSGAPVPVRFEAGSPEIFKSRSLIESEPALKGAGFGVFAYYTGATAWGDVGSSTTPNFMYNQQVTWSSDHWTYTPVKYWPNDNNPADNTGATGSQTHSYVSFFAYAPYSDMSSPPSSGVTAISANSATGAPVLTYTWAADADLLYASQTDRYKYDSNDANDNGRVGDVVPFIFRHALAKVVFKVRRSNNSHSVSLNSLSISYNTTGTFNLGTATWSSLGGSGSNTYSASLPINVEATTEALAHTVGSSIMLIPGSLTTYDVTYSVGGSNFTHTDAPFASGLIPSPGYQYTIIFTIDGDAIKVDTQKYTEQW